MKRTRAETAAQALKAGRGAGLPLGVAEEFAEATAFMNSDQLDRFVELLTSSGARSALTSVCEAVDDLACGGRPDIGVTDPAVLVPLAAGRGLTVRAGKKRWKVLPGAPQPEKAPLKIPGTVWAALGRLAKQTYVPESAASRARGAGAGAIDND